MKKASKAEIAHMGRIKGMACICCTLLATIQQSKTEVHHIREGREERNHWLTIPLCADSCHKGKKGVHGDKTYLRMLKMSEFGLLAATMERLEATV